MADFLLPFLQSITGNSNLTVFLISMFPLVELKGAIPVGSALGLDLLPTALLAFLGSTLVSVPILLLLRPIFNLLKRVRFFARFIEKVEGVFKRRAEKLSQKYDGNGESLLKRRLTLGVYAFVAIPLPLTGVWTGSGVAVFLGLDFKRCMLAVVLGNLTAGSFITLLTYLFSDYVSYIILGLAVLAVIMLIVFIVKVALSKPEKADQPPKNC